MLGNIPVLYIYSKTSSWLKLNVHEDFQDIQIQYVEVVIP